MSSFLPSYCGMAHHYSLPQFQGPLELLWLLIQRDEIDVCQLPLQSLLAQLLQQLELPQDPHSGCSDIEEKIAAGAEGFFGIANLLLIKSRRLLPEPTTGEELQDLPQIPLLKHLLEYNHLQRAAAWLTQREEKQRQHHLRQPLLPPLPPRPLTQIPLSEFASLVKKMMEKAAPKVGYIEEEPWTVEEQLAWVLQKAAAGKAKLTAYFNIDWPRQGWIATFLALLELMKQGKIVLYREGEDAMLEAL